VNRYGSKSRAVAGPALQGQSSRSVELLGGSEEPEGPPPSPERRSRVSRAIDRELRDRAGRDARPPAGARTVRARSAHARVRTTSVYPWPPRAAANTGRHREASPRRSASKGRRAR